MSEDGYAEIWQKCYPTQYNYFVKASIRLLENAGLDLDEILDFLDSLVSHGLNINPFNVRLELDYLAVHKMLDSL